MPLIRKPIQPPCAAAPDATVLTALVSGTDDERWAAARAAAEMPGGAQALGAALSHERNARVREAMFTSLARIASAESIELTLALLRSDDAAVRTGALDALRAMQDAVWPYVARLFADPDPDIRVLACELARDMPAQAASRLLCGLIEAETELNVCASAVEVLAELGEPDALPALARCGERFRSSPFLLFSIKIAADRIGSQSPQQRG